MDICALAVMCRSCIYFVCKLVVWPSCTAPQGMPEVARLHSMVEQECRHLREGQAGGSMDLVSSIVGCVGGTQLP